VALSGDVAVLSAPSPSPRSHGERAGVRGSRLLQRDAFVCAQAHIRDPGPRGGRALDLPLPARGKRVGPALGLVPSVPTIHPSASIRLVESWILGTSPRMTLEVRPRHKRHPRAARKRSARAGIGRGSGLPGSVRHGTDEVSVLGLCSVG
jgi:hypothetical protein